MRRRHDCDHPFGEIRRRYGNVYTIVSPPRCSSTAFARVFWEQPSVRFYCHEPFEIAYHSGQDLAAVARKLTAPLDLEHLKRRRGHGRRGALVIKEMPYQVGRHFPLLASISDRPLIFLMRDPRLNIASRMANKREAGDEALFPKIETGWELWAEQIRWCRSRGIDCVLVDSTDFRNRPLEILPRVFTRLGLPFRRGMLEWRACPEVDIDNLGGAHRHLYAEALGSAGIRPEDEPIPALESFPEKDGWRDHVAHCLAIYQEFGGAAERIRATPECGA